eukprot:TRINITY_DN3064_c0_g1_i1.p1 TRINITY_DN3064_c0_g1~~TRINITY_DN3064_c0_g1_i1.p1  ORF type:complete len:118 (+),score=20.12 TRINITY_DN3064_c0_g1_i1:464-817(+)
MRNAFDIGPYKEGFLMKKGHFRRNWNNRFFRIEPDNTLAYYKDANLSKLCGTINIKGSIIHIKHPSDDHFQIEDTIKGKLTFIRADCNLTMREWVDVIQQISRSISPDSEAKEPEDE